MSFSRQRSSAHTVRRQTPRAIARIANLFETDCRLGHVHRKQRVATSAIPCMSDGTLKGGGGGGRLT